MFIHYSDLVYPALECNLRNILESNQFFQSLHCEYVLYQIVQGVDYLHKHDIIHNYLSSRHILMTSNCQIKICGFRLARCVTSLRTNNTNVAKVATTKIIKIQTTMSK